MISFGLDIHGIDGVLAHLADIEYKLFDLRPLAEEIKLEMAHQNTLARALGIDQDGNAFRDLAESTWKKRERKGQFGPPLAPEGLNSPIIQMQVDIEEAHPDDITVRGTWPEAWWLQFHMTRWRTRPARRAVGFTPDSWARVEAAFEGHIAAILGL